MSTHSILIECHNDIDFPIGSLDCLFLLAPFGDVLGDELGRPLVLHAVLQISIVHHTRCFTKSKSLATQFKLFFALATETLRVAIGETQKVQFVFFGQIDDWGLEKPRKLTLKLVRHAKKIKWNFVTYIASSSGCAITYSIFFPLIVIYCIFIMAILIAIM